MDKASAEKIWQDAKAEQRKTPPKLPEMIKIVEELSSEIEGFELRSMEHLGRGGPSGTAARRVVALDDLARFLDRVLENEAAIRRALGSKKN